MFTEKTFKQAQDAKKLVKVVVAQEEDVISSNLFMKKASETSFVVVQDEPVVQEFDIQTHENDKLITFEKKIVESIIANKEASQQIIDEIKNKSQSQEYISEKGSVKSENNKSQQSIPQTQNNTQKTIKYHKKTKNCQIFDSTNLKPITNAVIILGSITPSNEYSFMTKAIMVDGENRTSFIMLSLPTRLGKTNVKSSFQFHHDQINTEHLMVKTLDTADWQEFKIQDVQSHALPLVGGIAKVITLEEKDEGKLPSMIYFVDGVEFLGQSKLLQSQKVEIYFENLNMACGVVMSYDRLTEFKNSNLIDPECLQEDVEELYGHIAAIQQVIEDSQTEQEYIIVKLDKEYVKPDGKTNKIGIREKYVLVVMDSMLEQTESEMDLKNVLVNITPHPIDPRMEVQDTSRVLVTDEVLMTQILCKIKDLIREDITRRQNYQESSSMSQKSKSANENRPYLNRVESRLLSPNRINLMSSNQEGVSIEHIELSDSEHKEHKRNEANLQSHSNSLKSIPANTLHPIEVENAEVEEDKIDIYIVQKEKLLSKVASLIKKKFKLKSKKSKNDDLIKNEKEKIEQKELEVKREKEILEEQRKKQISKLVGRPLLMLKVEETFDKYQEKVEKKEEKIAKTKIELSKIEDDLNTKTQIKEAEIDDQIAEVEEEIIEIELILNNQSISEFNNIEQPVQEEKEIFEKSLGSEKNNQLVLIHGKFEEREENQDEYEQLKLDSSRENERVGFEVVAIPGELLEHYEDEAIFQQNYSQLKKQESEDYDEPQITSANRSQRELINQFYRSQQDQQDPITSREVSFSRNKSLKQSIVVMEEDLEDENPVRNGPTPTPTPKPESQKNNNTSQFSDKNEQREYIELPHYHYQKSESYKCQQNNTQEECQSSNASKREISRVYDDPGVYEHPQQTSDISNSQASSLKNSNFKYVNDRVYDDPGHYKYVNKSTSSKKSEFSQKNSKNIDSSDLKRKNVYCNLINSEEGQKMTVNDDDLEREISQEMEKKLKMHKDLLRQELSETKSRILENLGVTSGNEETDSEQVLNESTTEGKFQKKTQQDDSYSSPKLSKKVEDSMVLSSSSSKKSYRGTNLNLIGCFPLCLSQDRT